MSGASSVKVRQPGARVAVERVEDGKLPRHVSRYRARHGKIDVTVDVIFKGLWRGHGTVVHANLPQSIHDLIVERVMEFHFGKSRADVERIRRAFAEVLGATESEAMWATAGTTSAFEYRIANGIGARVGFIPPSEGMPGYVGVSFYGDGFNWVGSVHKVGGAGDPLSEAVAVVKRQLMEWKLGGGG